jgi:hypothetical protein
MTIPVGVGKNACFGYEDEQPANTSGDPGPNELVSRGPAESLLCTEPSANDDPATATGGASRPPNGCTLTPDYYTVSGTAGFVAVAAVSVSVDRYGHVYTAGGGGAGAGVGGSAHVGYLRNPDHPCDPADEATLRMFLSGPAQSAGGGAGLSVGVVHSAGMTGREVGISTPQLGATYTLGAEHEGI